MAKFSAFLFLSYLIFVSCTPGEKKVQNPDVAPVKLTIANPDTAYFAGGCFWCTEAMFERVKGVGDVVSGYSGGNKPNPTYQEVSFGKTDYAETIMIPYNPEVIGYRTLVRAFYLGAHDPTQVDKQLPDIGKQYRSAIYFKTKEEETIARALRDSINQAGIFDKPIATEIEAFTNFYKAEDYHQNFYERNPRQGYVVNVALPKVKKFEKKFPHLLKEHHQAGSSK